jgi:hypothetical protein
MVLYSSCKLFICYEIVFLGSLLNPGEVINGADRAGGTAAKHLLLLAMGEPFFETATAASEEEDEAARKPALSTSQATSRPPKTLGPYDWRFNRLHSGSTWKWTDVAATTSLCGKTSSSA